MLPWRCHSYTRNLLWNVSNDELAGTARWWRMLSYLKGQLTLPSHGFKTGGPPKPAKSRGFISIYHLLSGRFLEFPFLSYDHEHPAAHASAAHAG